MKILYTLNSGQPGGMEYHTLDLVKGMTTRGHEVFVWCNPGPLTELFSKNGAKVSEHTVGFDLDAKYIKKISQFLKENKIEVLHTHELKAVTNSLLGASLAKTPVKISHTHTPISLWPMPSIKKLPTKFGYSNLINLFSDKEIALTNIGKKIKIKEGIKENKLVVIPNGFDQDKFAYNPEYKAEHKKFICEKYNVPQNKFIFGNLSRLSANKGIDQLVKAFKELLDENNSINKESTHLLLAGKGEFKLELDALVEELDLKDNVTITGTFPDSDHVKLYNAIDAFVFTSLSEGFGLVLIEAMALDIPIISSNLDVLQEVAGDHVYEYFDTLSIDSIKCSMLSIYNNYSAAQNKASEARDFVENKYSMSLFIDNYEHLYKDVLMGKKAKK